jgi:hypothetical protein
LTYLWQSSPDNITYTAISGANSAGYSTTQTAATWYRRITTCTASALSSNSAATQVTMNPSLFSCYCTSAAASSSDEDITTVTFKSINNTSACASLTGTQGVGTGTANLNASYVTTVPAPNIAQGESIPITVVTTECAGTHYTHSVKAYIDFDRNGDLNETNELVTLTNNTTNATTNTYTGTFNVPLGAVPGDAMLRIICKEATATTACGASSYGETEDYKVTIIVGSPCTGTEAVPTLTTNKANLCETETATITANGLPSTLGNTYLWETATASTGPWTTATGTSSGTTYTSPAAPAGYTDTYYRVNMICAAQSITQTSAAIVVAGAAAPTTQVTALTFTPSATSAVIAFTKGNGTKRAVFIAGSATSITDPINGTSPGTAATVYAGAGAQQLVYDGTGTTVTVTGLAPGTQYIVQAYEYLSCPSPANNNFYNLNLTNNQNKKFLSTADALGFNVSKNPSAPYNSIIGAGGSTFTWSTTASTPAVNAAWITDENYSLPITLPFPFTYQGVATTKFKAHVNGFITLSDIAYTSQLASNTINTTSVGQDKMIAPLLADLVTPGNPNTNASLSAANAPIQYMISGSAPNRVLTVEWAGMERYTIPSPNLNFQVKLYEGSNNIEFAYGQMEGYNGSTAVSWTYYAGMSGLAPATDFFTQQNIDHDFFKNTATTITQVLACNSSFTFSPNGSSTTFGTALVATAPANNDNTSAVILTVATEDPYTAGIGLCGTYYSSLGATASAQAVCAGTADDDVWFLFTATSSGTTVKVRGSNTYLSRVEILDASLTPVTPLPAPVCVVAGAGLTATAVTPTNTGDSYYVRVYNDGAGAASGQFSIIVYDTPFPPANDNCSGAILLTSGGGTCTPSAIQNCANATASAVTLLGGTANVGTPDDDVWFKFVPATNGNYNVHVQGNAGFNPAVHIMKSNVAAASQCTSLIGIKAQDFTSTAGLESNLLTNLKADTTYFIRVYHSGSGAGTGKFTICVSDAYTADFDGNTCNAYTGTAINGTTFTGWFNFISNQSAANPKPSGLNVQLDPQGVDLGTVTVNYKENLAGSANVPLSPPNSAGATMPFLPRFFGISSTTANPFPSAVKLRLYFSNQELADYNTAAGLSATPSTLNLSLISEGSATADCDPANNTNAVGEVKAPSASGTTPNGFWLEFETTHFTEFAALSPATPLPLKLISYKGTSRGTINELSWTTASEENIREFMVERSLDGKNWSTVIGKVLAKGSKSSTQTYTMTDNNPVCSAYYRLTSMENDNKTEKVGVVQILRRCDKFNIANVFPNPSTDKVNVQYESTSDSDISVSVLDMTGRVVLTSSTTALVGFNSAELDLSSLTSGTYIISMNNGQSIVTSRVTKN